MRCRANNGSRHPHEKVYSGMEEKNEKVRPFPGFNLHVFQIQSKSIRQV